MTPLVPISVVLIDPSDVSRAGISALFKKDPRFRFQGNAPDLRDIRGTGSKKVNLVAVDPLLDGHLDEGFLGAVLERWPNAAVMLLTDVCERGFMHMAYKRGARGLLLKSRTPAWFLLDAAYAVGTGYGLVTDRMLFEQILQEGPQGILSATPIFTSREQDVIALLGQGLSDDQIGLQLGIASTTVQTHVQRILQKTSTTNRFTLGAYLVRHMLVRTL